MNEHDMYHITLNLIKYSLLSDLLILLHGRVNFTNKIDWKNTGNKFFLVQVKHMDWWEVANKKVFILGQISEMHLRQIWQV